jgi:hypothetical protein
VIEHQPIYFWPRNGTGTYSEDTLDYEVVERLKRGFIARCERGGKLGGRVLLCVQESLAGEGKAAEEPHQALGRGPLLLLKLVLDKRLERGRLSLVRCISSTDFLVETIRIERGQSQKVTNCNVALEVGDDGAEGGGAEEIWEYMRASH